MVNRKQIIVIGSIVVLMGLLLSMDIKGLVKPQQDSSGGATASVAAPAKAYTLDEVSEAAKQNLNAALGKQVSDLEAALRSASGEEQLNLQKKLAQQWDDVNQSAPAAFYYEQIAASQPTFENWLKAGDRFTEAYQRTMDTLMAPALVEKAIASYQNADKIKAGTKEVRTGLGIAYVNGTPNPMEGIQLLLGVVKEDPKHIKANLNLGLFSMKSGQFDKAVDRFKTVIDQIPAGDEVEAEVWFYLASSYEQMGKKPDAIAAYLKTKEIAADPNMSSFVDRKVNELSN